jgi:uncharacterized RDD family membrane protein YckC
MTIPLPLAGLGPRLASLFYETLLLLALWVVAGFVVVGLMPEAPRGLSRLLFQVYLLAVAAVYFNWFWQRGGQTLAMKTWRLRLVSASGQGVDRRLAWKRFMYAVPGAILFGIGFFWALFDQDRLFLHDRLAGTRIVRSAPLDVPKAGDRDDAEQKRREKSADQGGPGVQ